MASRFAKHTGRQLRSNHFDIVSAKASAVMPTAPACSATAAGVSVGGK